MFEKDPLKRPSASEALQHAWFKSDEAILGELLNLNKLVCTNDPLVPVAITEGGEKKLMISMVSQDRKSGSNGAAAGVGTGNKPSCVLGSFLLGNNYFNKNKKKPQPAGSRGKSSFYHQSVFGAKSPKYQAAPTNKSPLGTNRL